jgi:hypothetical protein
MDMPMVAVKDLLRQMEPYTQYAVFQCWVRREDVEKATEKGKHAMAGTRQEDEAYAPRLDNVGVMLESRYKRRGKMKELEEAIKATQNAWKYENAAPFVRIRASTLALYLLQKRFLIV